MDLLQVCAPELHIERGEIDFDDVLPASDC